MVITGIKGPMRDCMGFRVGGQDFHKPFSLEAFRQLLGPEIKQKNGGQDAADGDPSKSGKVAQTKDTDGEEIARPLEQGINEGRCPRSASQ